MVIVTLDTENIGGAIAALVTAAIGTYGYLKSKGYISRWKGYISAWKTKLGLDLEVANAAHKQNGQALTKLNLSDDLVCYLQMLALKEDGTIDEEKVIQFAKDYIRLKNNIIRTIPNMKEVEKK